MFTGLIKYRGELAQRTTERISVKAPELVAVLSPGDSVAVDGVCLTVKRILADGFEAQLLPETRQSSTLGGLPLGAKLNLEPALQVGDRLGGHYVQGHVDGVVALEHRERTDAAAWRMRFTQPDWLEPLIVVKGSVAINGVSLTVQTQARDSFSVAIISETYQRTNLGSLRNGDPANVEADIILVAVQQALQRLASPGQDLTLEQLRNLGYGS